MCCKVVLVVECVVCVVVQWLSVSVCLFVCLVDWRAVFSWPTLCCLVDSICFV